MRPPSRFNAGDRATTPRVSCRQNAEPLRLLHDNVGYVSIDTGRCPNLQQRVALAGAARLRAVCGVGEDAKIPQIAFAHVTTSIRGDPAVPDERFRNDSRTLTDLIHAVETSIG
jgi:hypothetical protein